MLSLNESGFDAKIAHMLVQRLDYSQIPKPDPQAKLRFEQSREQISSNVREHLQLGRIKNLVSVHAQAGGDLSTWRTDLLAIDPSTLPKDIRQPLQELIAVLPRKPKTLPCLIAAQKFVPVMMAAKIPLSELRKLFRVPGFTAWTKRAYAYAVDSDPKTIEVPRFREYDEYSEILYDKLIELLLAHPGDTEIALQ